MTLTYNFTPPSNPSPQLRAAQAWVEAANSLDKEKAASATADDYMHVFLPEDAGLPRLTREQWVNRVDIVGKTLAEFDTKVKEIIESPGVVAFYSTVHVKTPGGNINDSEILVLLYVTEQPDGSFKVSKAREFVDTAKFAKFDADVKKEFGLPTA